MLRPKPEPRSRRRPRRPVDPHTGKDLHPCINVDLGCTWLVTGLWCEECWEEYLSDPDAFK